MEELKDSVVINNIHYTLTDLEKDCWIRLVNGAVKGRDPFHLPAVANFLDGEISLRTVVLRKALPDQRELRFHTDTRSPKWKALQENPAISALFYDASARIQLRVKGKVVLYFNDAVTADAWEKTNLSSRRCYLTTFTPSDFSDIPTSGLSTDIEQEEFSLEESEVGKENFGVVGIKVDSIDWLWLNHAGHRRAFFDYVKGEYHWMIP
ncbi:MAG: hypothetical protein RI983_2002 [Bacteroidota bacterium]|jgi:3-hydroxyisobutyrate dehydrogenase